MVGVSRSWGIALIRNMVCTGIPYLDNPYTNLARGGHIGRMQYGAVTHLYNPQLWKVLAKTTYSTTRSLLMLQRLNTLYKFCEQHYCDLKTQLLVPHFFSLLNF